MRPVGRDRFSAKTRMRTPEPTPPGQMGTRFFPRSAGSPHPSDGTRSPLAWCGCLAPKPLIAVLSCPRWQIGTRATHADESRRAHSSVQECAPHAASTSTKAGHRAHRSPPALCPSSRSRNKAGRRGFAGRPDRTILKSRLSPKFRTMQMNVRFPPRPIFFGPHRS